MAAGTVRRLKSCGPPMSQTMNTTSSSVSKPASLVLRFVCTACRSVLHLSLRKLDDDSLCCPQCRSGLDVPDLDEEITGWDVVTEAVNSRNRVKLICPECSRSLGMTGVDAGKRQKCPACHTWLTFQFVGDEPTQPSKTGHPSHNNGRRSPAFGSAPSHRDDKMPQPREDEMFTDILASAPPVMHPASTHQARPRQIR